jgi:hypothetical protein
LGEKRVSKGGGWIGAKKPGGLPGRKAVRRPDRVVLLMGRYHGQSRGSLQQPQGQFNRASHLGWSGSLLPLPFLKSGDTKTYWSTVVPSIHISLCMVSINSGLPQYKKYNMGSSRNNS